MTTKDWIALGFSAAFLIFLFITFFIRPNLTRSQHLLLRIFMSVFAAFAGSLWAGKVFFEGKGTISNGMEISITATAGVALFLIVWFTYPGHKTEEPTKPDNAYSFSITEGHSFESVVQGIVIGDDKVHEIKGFSLEQLSLKLDARQLHKRNATEALESLRYLNKQLPPYKVTLANGIYTIEKL